MRTLAFTVSEMKEAEDFVLMTGMIRSGFFMEPPWLLQAQNKLEAEVGVRHEENKSNRGYKL